MLISGLAGMVNENAVEHGWWDEERGLPEVFALIHSEWSEALEEARDGKPLAYVNVTRKQTDENGKVTGFVPVIVERGTDGTYPVEDGDLQDEHMKPEGIAVELIDGCIRILDLIGQLKRGIMVKDKKRPMETGDLIYGKKEEWTETSLAELICILHEITADALKPSKTYFEFEADMADLATILRMVFSWIDAREIDPLALLMEKHEYNRTRPYKHGKKF